MSTKTVLATKGTKFTKITARTFFRDRLALVISVIFVAETSWCPRGTLDLIR